MRLSVGQTARATCEQTFPTPFDSFSLSGVARGIANATPLSGHHAGWMVRKSGEPRLTFMPHPLPNAVTVLTARGRRSHLRRKIL